MITREKIVEEVQNVPDEHLEELYRFIRQFEARKNGESGQSVMAQLREIKISASPDLSLRGAH